MEQYHGTNISTASVISTGNIDVTLGGGELGQGFYTGNLSYEAFNWAWHKYGKNNMAVVKFTLDDDDLLNLKPLCLTTKQTRDYRKKIRNRGETRKFKFSENVVWAPVVGKDTSNFHQFKYESDDAKKYLNGNSVIKDTF